MADILMVIAGAAPTAEEAEWHDDLEGNGHTVDYVEDTATEVTTGYDVVLVGPGASGVGTKYDGTNMPVLWAYGPGASDVGIAASETIITSRDTYRVLGSWGGFTGLADTNEIAVFTAASGWYTLDGDDLAPGAVPLASIENVGNDDEDSLACVIIPAGGSLVGGGTKANNIIFLALNSTQQGSADRTAAFDLFVEDCIGLAQATWAGAIPTTGTALTVLYVVNGVTGGEPNDADSQRCKLFMEEFGHTVTAIDDAGPDTTAGYDVAVISGAAATTATYDGVSGLPAVHLGGPFADERNLTQSSHTNMGVTRDRLKHPAGAEFTFTGWSLGDEVIVGGQTTNPGEWDPATALLADAVVLLENQSDSNEAAAFTLEVGSTLDDSSTTTERVVVFGWQTSDSWEGDLHLAAAQLLEDAMQWAANITPAPEPEPEPAPDPGPGWTVGGARNPAADRLLYLTTDAEAASFRIQVVALGEVDVARNPAADLVVQVVSAGELDVARHPAADMVVQFVEWPDADETVVQL